MSQVLDELMASLDGLPEAERKALYERAAVATHGYKWLPSPGAQTRAYFCPADVLLYGGMGGGGKSDLGLGLAFTTHKRSLILRRKYANLSALTERTIEINGTRSGYNGSPPPLLRTIRKQEINTDIPADWTSYREAVRTTTALAISDMEATTDIDAFIASVSSVQWPVSPDSQPVVVSAPEQPVAPVVEPIQPVSPAQ